MIQTHHRRAAGRVASHIPPGILLRRHSIQIFCIRRLTPDGRTFHPDVSHPEFFSADIPSGYFASGAWCRMGEHSTRMSHIRNSSLPTFHPDISHPAPDAKWERRAFQLPQSDISGSSDSVYPESFVAILHNVTVFSWSFPICLTDILRYFALDIWCLNPQTLLVTHQW